MRFEAVYAENVGALSGFFARRCGDPQTVADLTSQTFVEAIGSAHTFAGRGAPRAWLFAIAKAVYAQHCAGVTEGRDLTERLGGRPELVEDEIDDLAQRIDAQRQGRALMARAAQLPSLEREAVELVDLTGLTPKEAAQVLGVAPVSSGSGCSGLAIDFDRNRTMTDFDNGLWARLIHDHDADRVVLATPTRRRRSRPAILTVSAIAIAAAAAVLVLILGATTSTPPAYALTPHPDGTATITLNDLTTGIPALNARLAKLRIRSTVVPIRAGCRASTFEPVAGRGSLSETVTVGNRWIPAGYHGFLAAEQLPDGKIAIAIGTTKQPIPACFPQLQQPASPPQTPGASPASSVAWLVVSVIGEA